MATLEVHRKDETNAKTETYTLVWPGADANANSLPFLALVAVLGRRLLRLSRARDVGACGIRGGVQLGNVSATQADGAPWMLRASRIMVFVAHQGILPMMTGFS
jgi:hypothetical protein